MRSTLKKIPLLRTTKRWLWSFFNGRRGASRLDVLEEFPLYVPDSAGTYEDLAPLTIQTIKRVFPILSEFSESVKGAKISVTKIEDFPESPEDREAAEALKSFFEKHGSDKSGRHRYHLLYGPVLKHRANVSAILEIGMGTNNTDVVSNMGTEGKPGASLRAFRDFCPGASVFGADIDVRILFEEERIKTFFVDQTDQGTFDELGGKVPAELDLFIDDGLHSPDANLTSLRFGLERIKVGGWAIVEDINHHATPVWEVVAALLPDRYEPHLIKDGEAVLFAVRRLK